jgi:large subunit ribosomal protein L21
MAFAVIETGGKQYKVAEGNTLSVEKLPGHTVGDKVVFDKVLVLDDGTTTKVGTPYIAGAKVEVELIAEGKGKKIHIQKYKSKSRYKRRVGHRQAFAKVKVTKA